MICFAMIKISVYVYSCFNFKSIRLCIACSGVKRSVTCIAVRWPHRNHNLGLPKTSIRWGGFLLSKEITGLKLSFGSSESDDRSWIRHDHRHAASVRIQRTCSVRPSYLQWTTMGVPLCDFLLPQLRLMSLIMSVRSWGFSGTSPLAHFRNWKCFTGRPSFLCRHKWGKTTCDTEMTNQLAPWYW